MNKKEKQLEQLTGVNSSKLNYYVELKKTSVEALKQNWRLEVLHQLLHDIDIDMSIQDILDRTFTRLPQALPCSFMALIALNEDELHLKAVAPRDYCRVSHFPDNSPSWKVIRSKQATIFNASREECSHVWQNTDFPEKLSSFAIAPLFERAKVIGVMVVGRTNEAEFSGPELDFISHLTDQMAISIQNSRLYRQVARTTKQWEETFNAVTDPVFLVDANYNILRHNDRFTPEISRHWQQSLVNKCYSRLHGNEEPCHFCAMEEIKKTGQPAHRNWPTDSGVLLETYYYPIFNEDNKLAAFTIILKDVTQKTKMEAQLLQSAKLAALGEMAAGVAHELNSPMTVIIGTAQMLAREFDSESLENESLQDVINCGLRCKRIIQNLLTFSRQDQMPMTDSDINEQVRLVLGLIRYQINRNQIQIIDNLDPNLGMVNINGAQIQQVLTNLLINARDALNESGREHKQITVSSFIREDEDQRWAIISVHDNGTGIDQENLKKIFTPFFTSKDATKGTGLGLSVSLGIAESHSGTIEVESTPGEGSTFSLLLPVPSKGIAAPPSIEVRNIV